ncbi:hypothetical protein KY284_030188 [Solanum tuberosum]|nr:hypothetical protein KY284_030188 [Solanum tuberosum]
MEIRTTTVELGLLTVESGTTTVESGTTVVEFSTTVVKFSTSVLLMRRKRNQSRRRLFTSSPSAVRIRIGKFIIAIASFDQIKFELYDDGVWYMAYIMDTNEEERVKGITVEVGRAPFEIETTRFTILGAPGTEIQLGLALESQNATLSVKRRLACEAVSYYAHTLCCLSGDNNFHGTAKKHLLFIKWKYLEAKVNSEHSLAEAIV